jgi:hypothetical protein
VYALLHCRGRIRQNRGDQHGEAQKLDQRNNGLPTFPQPFECGVQVCSANTPATFYRKLVYLSWREAVKRRPGKLITLRQKARVIKKSR